MNSSLLRGALACVAVSIALFGSNAHAQSPDDDPYAPRKFACPIGGQVFEQRINYPALVLVQFPDGSWLGDHLIDAQVPECPKDGLVLIPDFEAPTDTQELTYRTYTPAQVAKLATLVNGDEFRALHKRGRYERAEWIGRQLDLPPYTRLQLLMRASWATTNAADRKRLVGRIASEGPALINAMSAPPLAKLGLRLRVANALRELGRFDETQAELAAIAAAEPVDADLADPDSVNMLRSSVVSMGEAVALRDDDRFPIDLSSERWARQACGGNLPAPYGPLTANGRAACKRMQANEKAEADVSARMDHLLANPELLQQQCTATPADKRAPGLARACDFQQSMRDNDAGDVLLAEHAPEVAAQCELTAQLSQPRGPMWNACIGYRSAVESALGRLLVDDDAGYAVVCSNGKHQDDLAAYASLACSTAERERTERAVNTRTADTATLDADCAATPQNKRELVLYMACSQRARDLEQLRAERLAADTAAYQAQCAAFDAKGDDRFWMDLSESDMQCVAAQRVRERAKQPPAAPRPPRVIPPSIYSADSELSKVARESARTIIAKAKAEQTYPKRKRGDLY